ncbi:MAG: carbohydrate ABC transporter substrate-binding protein, partial [Ilumatobacter sp.]|nr:carbohydrate ABC transporter substrate-binding protein [Ilumatobacter sp.]
DEWIAAERSDEYLLRGGRLDQLHGWAATTSLPLSEPEQAFLDASIAERDRAAADEQEREQRALEAERRERQRARQLVAAGVVTALVAGLAIFGVLQWRSAEDSRAEAEVARDTLDSVLLSESMARASRDRLSDGEPDVALALAIQGLRELVGVEGQAGEPPLLDAAHFALQAMGVQYEVGPDTRVSVRPGPDGPTGVYVLSAQRMAEIGDAASDRRLNEFECGIYYGGQCPDPVDVPADQGGYFADETQPPGGQALAGTTVTVAAASLREEPGLERQLADFTELTGIEVELVSNTGEALLALESGNFDVRPDVLAWGGGLPDWARGRALDLGQFLDHETLRADFGDFALNFATRAEPAALAAPNTVAYAVPLDSDIKGLVYYPKAAFATAGYEIPETWDELMALSRRIVDDGGSPWCVAFESGFPFNGWPGTDLIESLVLRSAGTEVYDGWATGDVAFTDPEIERSAQLADSLIFEPGFVRVGPQAISNENFTEQMFHLLQRDTVTGAIEPDCWMFFQGDFMFGAVPPGTVVGADVDYFPLPPMSAGETVPVIGSVTSMVGIVDRPEVRALLEYVADPTWGAVWATEPGNGLIPMNRRFDTAAFDLPEDPSAGVRRRLFADTRSALEAGSFRFDASDFMPRAIGGWLDDPPGLSAFNAGMVDWVDGVRTIDEVLADIDAAWSELRSGGA